VFNDFTCVIQAENINPGVFQTVRPYLVAMQDNELSFRDRALNFNAFAGILFGHLLKVRDERRLTVTHMRVVLDVYLRRTSGGAFEMRAAKSGHPVQNSDVNLGFCFLIFDGVRL